MATTFISLQEKVRRLTKISINDAELVQLIRDAINVAMFDTARAHRWPELLQLRVTIVSLAGLDEGIPVKLPDDFMLIERVKFHSNGQEWKLFPRTGIVPPAKVEGKPRVYVIGGEGDTFDYIMVEPFAQVTPSIGDAIIIDYYSKPNLLSNDTDQLVSDNWDTEIIKRAANYVYTYQNKLEMAQAMWASILNPTLPSSKPEPEAE